MKINIDRNYVKIFLISLSAIFLDYIWLLNNTNSPPGWDQGYHLANVFKMQNILDNQNIFFTDKLSNILNVTDSYRGPLTYFLSAIILKIFGENYSTVFLSNSLFNFICIFSTYKICEVFKQKEIGIWSIILFTFSPFIFVQRTDYLIDISLTSFSMLFFLTLTFWFKSSKEFSIYSYISGITFGLLFLVKPTGIILFIFPLIINLIRRLYLLKKFIFMKEFISFITTFLLSIYPWFSRHWITIFSSINNAWNWGRKYQDGLEFNSIEGWIYYFKIIPQFLGLNLFLFILILFIFNLIKAIKDKKIGNNDFKKIHIWLFSFLINCFLILSFMSTKETRFLLPAYPIICIYLSFILNNINKFSFFKIIKKWIVISLIIFTFISKQSSLRSLQNSPKIIDNFDNWHHQEIIKTISNENPLINQTLAVLPDTKEVNTFNLEAEALRQGGLVTVRQIISNEENYKSDLQYFDWFLLKSGDQGIMNNKAKILLNNYLFESDSFFTFKRWTLPDKSEVILLRRNNLNSVVNERICKSNIPSLKINQYKEALKINFLSKGYNINNSNLFIDINYKNINEKINLPLLNGRLYKPLVNEKCYEISHIIPFKLRNNQIDNGLIIDSFIINNNEKIIPKISLIDLSSSKEFDNQILYENKITKVMELGNLIKNGDFDKLFYLVGILNQSDPSQVYLKEAEKIYTERYQKNENLENLYAILASQILQKKSKDSEKTLKKILNKDPSNGNTYLAKTIIEIYQLKFRNAKKSIYFAKKLDFKSSQSERIINDILKFTSKF